MSLLFFILRIMFSRLLLSYVLVEDFAILCNNYTIFRRVSVAF